MKPSFIALLLGLLTLSLVYNYFDERVIEVPVVVPVAEGGAPNIQLGTRPYFLIDDMDEALSRRRSSSVLMAHFIVLTFPLATVARHFSIQSILESLILPPQEWGRGC